MSIFEILLLAAGLAVSLAASLTLRGARLHLAAVRGARLHLASQAESASHPKITP